MSVTVLERAQSRGLVNDPKATTAQREYWAFGSMDEVEINDAIAVEAPDFWLGLEKQAIKTNNQGGDFWYSVVDYGLAEGAALDGQGDDGDEPEAPPELTDADKLGPDFGFTTSGGTQHITQSLNTLEKTGFNGAAVPDNQNAIGVLKDRIEGTDVLTPKFEFSLSKRVAFITMKYIRRLVACTGKVNRNDWQTFKAGEVLFLGAEGKYEGNGNGDDSWLITFKFAAGKNEVDIPIREGTPGLVVASKRAFDYLWLGYADETDSAANAVMQRPMYAYVEEVYESADFKTELGF